MADQDRRRRLVAYLERKLGGDRSVLIKRSGLTQGRISQLFDPRQSFGERSASGLATRLGLPADYFEHDTPLSPDALALAAAYDQLQPSEKARFKLLLEAARESVHCAAPCPT